MGPELITPVVVAAGGWVAGILLFGRLRPCDEASARLTAPLPAAFHVPTSPLGDEVENAKHVCGEARLTTSLSIIIPARDEAHRLPVLLDSIGGQNVRPFEVIVVDDGSTDGTAAAAGGRGATVVTAPPLPAGWRGKTWACHCGANAATGEVLLFLDADTWFEPGGLARVLATFAGGENGGRGALSVVPYHAVREPYEQLSAPFNLVMTAGVGAFTVPRRRPDGLFGQMLLVDAGSYRAVGGHEAVRGDVLENVCLGRLFKRAGVATACRIGQGTLAVRMYGDGLPGLIRGWAKGFGAGPGATAPAVLLGVVLWLSGAVTAAVLLCRHPLFAGAIAYAAFVLQIGWLLRRLGSFRPYAALLYPIGLVFFFAVFARALVGPKRNVSWKGRAVHAD